MRPATASPVTIAPRIEVHLTAEELAIAAGISRLTLTRLRRLGLVESIAPGSNTFTAESAARLRRMLRLRADLGVNLVGAAIIVDLVARLQRMERDLGRLRGQRMDKDLGRPRGPS